MAIKQLKGTMKPPNKAPTAGTINSESSKIQGGTSRSEALGKASTAGPSVPPDFMGKKPKRWPAIKHPKHKHDMQVQLLDAHG